MAFDTADFIVAIDGLTALWLDYKASTAAADAATLLGTVVGWGDFPSIQSLGVPLNTLSENGSYIPIAKPVMGPPIGGLAALCKAAGISGVSNIDGYASYYNKGAGGPYAALMPPDAIDLLTNVANLVPSTCNVYSPAISDMATGVRVSSGSVTFDSVATVDTTQYAGVAILKANVASVSGSGVLTVTATARTAAGVITTGRLFTATISGTGLTTLTPTVSGDIATAITGISCASGLTDISVTIEGLVPSGRSNPPTL